MLEKELLEYSSDADYYDVADELEYDEPMETSDEEPHICNNCAGSCEGMWDGSTCIVCKGRGEIK